MKAELLLAQFNRISEAPDAVQRLRKFLLDLAVRGKLVEHDLDDEPASDLIRRIQARKAEIVKESGIKQGKPLLPFAEKEPAFQIPQNWCWSQLAEIGFLNPRNVAGDKVLSSFVPMPLISAEYGVASSHEVRAWGEIKSGYTHFAEGDVALAKITPCFENGKSTVFRGLTGGIGAGTTELHVVRPILVYSDYILAFLKCPHFIESGIPRMTGTAGQKRVPTEYFAYSRVPIPPLREQYRILAKLTELMELCDRLEAVQVERERRRGRLTAASHHHLNNATSPKTIRSQAQFFIGHLPRLTANSDQIKQLRQTILELGVRGRLVGRDPNDEPAPSFGIPGNAGKDRLDLELHDGWNWTMVENVAGARLGKMLDKAKNSGKLFRYLRNTNVHWFDVRTDELKELKIEESEVEKYRLIRGDVLICEGGHGIGRTAVWRRDEADIVFQKALHRVRPGPTLESDFFSYCMFVYFHAGVLQTYFTGVGIPHFTGKALATLVFPLPPLAEQRRIVAKVNELMRVCDQLEAQLAVTQTDSSLLLEAVLSQALNDNRALNDCPAVDDVLKASNG
jgi:type I restriction enzyme, S subunit